MKRTLILAVDRDNDFGVKAGVESPAIGIEDVTDAAMRLGKVDPEDSDVNALFSAIRIRDELFQEGKDVEVALLCGDKKVGHKSDAMIIDQLELVLEEVNPDRVILVSDGAEDEFVYPIISSRVPIDSVKKVFVKQAPGLEGSLYIMSRMLRDNDKRQRFLAPVGWILIILGLIFTLPRIAQYISEGDPNVIYNMTGSLFILALGAIFCIFAYNLADLARQQYDKIAAEIKSGNISIVFSVLGMVLFLGGFAVGAFAVLGMYESSLIYKTIIFFSNILWMAIFAIICNGFGKFVDNYMKTRMFNRTFLITTLTILSLAFFMQGVLDIVSSLFGYGYVGESIVVYEFLIGIGFGMCAAILQMSFKEFFESLKGQEEETEDAVS